MNAPRLPAEVFHPDHVVTSSLQSIEDLTGPAGRLEAVLNVPAVKAPLVAVLCHPYPPAGGTLHTKVVYHAMKSLVAVGVTVLRFNFRGVGRSEGAFDGGHGEQEDVRAAIDWLGRSFGLPILCAGFSFGSYVALRACCTDTRIAGRIGLGLPVRAAARDYTYEFLPACPGPMLFVSGDQDEFSPAKMLNGILAGVPSRKRTVVIEGADHFFQGVPGSATSKLPRMQLAIREWMQDEFSEA